MNGLEAHNAEVGPMTATLRSTITIGLDLGDRFSTFCVLDAAGTVCATGRGRTTPEALRQQFGAEPPARIVLEVGTHSPWVSRLLAELGHEVLVANARQLRLIYGSDRKTDCVDAETLARLGRLDPALLHPIRHRGLAAQARRFHKVVLGGVSFVGARCWIIRLRIMDPRVRCARYQPSMSGHGLLDERANLGFRRGVQRGEGPRDRVHVGALLASGVHDFAEAECDEVLV